MCATGDVAGWPPSGLSVAVQAASPTLITAPATTAVALFSHIIALVSFRRLTRILLFLTETSGQQQAGEGSLIDIAGFVRR
ncbi:hypothetical protein GCM10011410_13650 [Hoyosella rhizosphaerae]|uniref:Uncharacterized protein n=1 Tax=Hoyosella rhizosphaerae TaxID=1755582 RepID=A0A916U7Y6_9ACTN|nr:hypothetical protein GCM10011410_13650 [Hoyosella rhizosphaerae]